MLTFCSLTFPQLNVSCHSRDQTGAPNQLSLLYTYSYLIFTFVTTTNDKTVLQHMLCIDREGKRKSYKVKFRHLVGDSQDEEKETDESTSQVDH